MQFEPYLDYQRYSPSEMALRARKFYEEMRRRRSVRQFAPTPIPEGVLENCLRAAGTAPSGANHQPWHFAVIRDPKLKSRIREAAEKEEHAFYHGRAPQEWLEALAPLGTDEHKPFLEDAPALIGIFARSFEVDEKGGKKKNYYIQESVGIATGFLIAAIHQAGLCCLTHTPSPMGFLREILGRPPQERPFLLLVVGYPAEGVTVPALSKHALEEIASFW